MTRVAGPSSSGFSDRSLNGSSGETLIGSASDDVRSIRACGQVINDYGDVATCIRRCADSRIRLDSSVVNPSASCATHSNLLSG